MTYAESESMALKRLKVALKRKDWQFFDYGITRTHELIKSGTKISEIQQWYELLDTAKKENVPPEHTDKLSSIINNILTPAQTSQKDSEPVLTAEPSYITHRIEPTSINIEEIEQESIIEEEPEEIVFSEPEPEEEPEDYTEQTSYIEENTEINFEESSVNEVIQPEIISKPVIKRKNPLTIFINKEISSDQTIIIDTIKYYISKLNFEYDQVKDLNFLSTLSNLLNKIEKEEIGSLIKLIRNCNEPGVIITTSYSSQLTNLLTENDIDFEIEGIKEAKTDNYWKIHPLRGLTSIFWCPKCKNKTFYNNDDKTITTICSNCNEPAYPDLYAINSTTPDTNPREWYHSYQILTNSDSWLLVSPPKNTENKIIYDLLATASSNCKLKYTYIVSNDSKTREHWEATLNETESQTTSYTNLSELINNHLNL
ncbi:MAG: hypothetical protein AB7V50_01485 [Vampirovibrionia bacterium]